MRIAWTRTRVSLGSVLPAMLMLAVIGGCAARSIAPTPTQEAAASGGEVEERTFDDLVWNLILPASSDGNHSGRVSLTPLGQVHEGRGDTGTPRAVYHFHPRDRDTGGLAPAIPWDKNRQPIEGVPGQQPGTVLDSGVEGPVLTGNWQLVVHALTRQDEPLAHPAAQFLMGHAFLALNRNNEAFLLLWTAGAEAQRTAWHRWTSSLARRHPDNPGVHYLHGDALARVGKWEAAEAELDRALELDPELFLALHARGLVRLATGRIDAAAEDFDDLTVRFPSFTEGQISYGTFWFQQRAPEGALRAFDAALDLEPDSLLARNGRACALYGLGEWEEAADEFARAAQQSHLVELPFILNNRREVAVAQDTAIIGSDRSPLFRPSDFLDWDTLRKATSRKNDLLRTLLGRSLPAEPDQPVLDTLNAALDDPAFWDAHRESIALPEARDALADLVASTRLARHKRSSELPSEEREQIRRLNRRLIELAYPLLIERFDARHPGTTMVTRGGLQSSSALMNQGMFSGGSSALRGAPVLNSLATAGLGAISPGVGVANAMGQFHQRFGNNHDALMNLRATASVAVNLGQVAFGTGLATGNVPLAVAGGVGMVVGGGASAYAQHRLDALHHTNVGGVIVDLRRAYIDKGDWHVEAPFSLAYYATSDGALR